MAPKSGATLHTPIPRSRLHPGRAVLVCVLLKGDRLAAQQGFHAACDRFAMALGKVAQNQQQKIRVIRRQAGLQQALFQLLWCNLLIDDVPACNPREDGPAYPSSQAAAYVAPGSPASRRRSPPDIPSVYPAA